MSITYYCGVSRAADVESLRWVSRAAFGQAYRLEAMLAITDVSDGVVDLSSLALSVGVTASNLQGAVRSLVATGLLSELPRGDSRRKYLLRNPSPAWEWAHELGELAEAISLNNSVPSRLR